MAPETNVARRALDWLRAWHQFGTVRAGAKGFRVIQQRGNFEDPRAHAMLREIGADRNLRREIEWLIIPMPRFWSAT